MEHACDYRLPDCGRTPVSIFFGYGGDLQIEVTGVTSEPFSWCAPRVADSPDGKKHSTVDDKSTVLHAFWDRQDNGRERYS